MVKPSYITMMKVGKEKSKLFCILVCKETTPAKIELSIWKWTRLYSNTFNVLQLHTNKQAHSNTLDVFQIHTSKQAPDMSLNVFQFQINKLAPFLTITFSVPNTFQGSLYSNYTKETFQKEMYCVNTKFTFQKVNIFEISKMNLSMQIRRERHFYMSIHRALPWH